MYSRARRIAIPPAGLPAIGLAAGMVGSTAAGATPPSDVVSKNAATPAEQAVQFWTPDRIKLAADYDTDLDAKGRFPRQLDLHPVVLGGDDVGGQGFTWNRTKANVFSFGYLAGEHPDGDKHRLPDRRQQRRVGHGR
ncbi:hypothetical protein AB0F17_36345 [Nonomuraea sp. NPDC026600]|uniref:hypothetical protein n=1 Tax=Nonomuraea sp. NPDC026600 TaxID=3155363 RepID=UPI0033D173BF